MTSGQRPGIGSTVATVMPCLLSGTDIRKTPTQAVQGSDFEKLGDGDQRSGRIIATSAEVTPNCGLVRESFLNLLNSGLGIIYSNVPRTLISRWYCSF